MTNYNNRTYRLRSVHHDIKPTSTFKTKNGDISYIQYYQQNYNLRITDKNQPLFCASPSNFERRDAKSKDKKIFLIPEFCHIAGLTDDQAKNFRVRKAIIEKSQLVPEKRRERYTEFLKTMNSTKDVQTELNKWGIKYDNKFIEVAGVKLAGEKLQLRNESVTFAQQTADFTHAIRGKALYKVCNFQNWHILYEPNDAIGVRKFLDDFRKLCDQFGKY